MLRISGCATTNSAMPQTHVVCMEDGRAAQTGSSIEKSENVGGPEPRCDVRQGRWEIRACTKCYPKILHEARRAKVLGIGDSDVDATEGIIAGPPLPAHWLNEYESVGSRVSNSMNGGLKNIRKGLCTRPRIQLCKVGILAESPPNSPESLSG